MSARSWRIAGLVCGVIAGASAVGFGLWVHAQTGYRLGVVWHWPGVTVTAPRLLVVMGVVMLVGGVLLLWNDVAGGILVGMAASAGLLWAFRHPDHMMPNLKLWEVAVVLAFLSSMCAGYSLAARVQKVGSEGETEAVAASEAEATVAPAATEVAAGAELGAEAAPA